MPSFPIRSTPPQAAVPPGRIGYDLDADVLLLHTVQTKAAFGQVLATGILQPKPQLPDTRQRVLLSHFDEWHSALNSSVAVPKLPGESEDEFDARWRHVYDDFGKRRQTAGTANSSVRQWPKELREDAEQSWECIYNRTIFSPTDYWQATVHEIHAADVVEAVRIIS